MEGLIRQLDGLGSAGSVAVIPLTSMDPVTAAATLRSMFIRDGADAPTIEADLYGRQIEVEFIDFIRADRRFDGPEALKEQMGKDVAKVREILATAGPTPA